jgi:hypothetical protein
LVDKIDETGCCDRLFGQVVVTGYLYRFGAWLMHLFMVQVEVQVGAWLMHLFMVQVDYRLVGTGWCMVDALVYGTGWLRYRLMVQVIGTLVQVVWYRIYKQYISQ